MHETDSYERSAKLLSSRLKLHAPPPPDIIDGRFIHIAPRFVPSKAEEFIRRGLPYSIEQVCIYQVRLVNPKKKNDYRAWSDWFDDPEQAVVHAWRKVNKPIPYVIPSLKADVLFPEGSKKRPKKKSSPRSPRNCSIPSTEYSIAFREAYPIDIEDITISTEFKNYMTKGIQARFRARENNEERGLKVPGGPNPRKLYYDLYVANGMVPEEAAMMVRDIPEEAPEEVGGVRMPTLESIKSTVSKPATEQQVLDLSEPATNIIEEVDAITAAGDPGLQGLNVIEDDWDDDILPPADDEDDMAILPPAPLSVTPKVARVTIVRYMKQNPEVTHRLWFEVTIPGVNTDILEGTQEPFNKVGWRLSVARKDTALVSRLES